ncbi:unnamed protein product [Dibothriocephalus latus]|uniref:Uncharacterized protein n=1 Tax=Dibothriocephalus latus TaxID=60516 RepID=A0A3P7NAS7_DIBLA|nr:unnamed protein product [Dibothriocephalus latus]
MAFFGSPRALHSSSRSLWVGLRPGTAQTATGKTGSHWHPSSSPRLHRFLLCLTVPLSSTSSVPTCLTAGRRA